jgi:general secretion pathway protein C
VADKSVNTTTSGKSAVKTPGKSPATQVGKAQKVKKNEPYSIITKRSLFGKIEQKEIQKETAPAEPLKATTLDLILLGTISGDGNTQRAIIQQQRDKTQDIYHKGDAVGSAIIKEVKRGKIILTVDGKDEVLLMKEPKSSQVRSKVKPPIRKKRVKPPQAYAPITEAAIPLRKITFKTDDTQETDQ